MPKQRVKRDHTATVPPGADTLAGVPASGAADDLAEPKGLPTSERYQAETVHHHPSQVRPDKPPHTE